MWFRQGGTVMGLLCAGCGQQQRAGRRVEAAARAGVRDCRRLTESSVVMMIEQVRAHTWVQPALF